MAQVALSRTDERQPSPRDTMLEQLNMGEPRKRTAGMISGLDIHYDLGEASLPLLGKQKPHQPSSRLPIGRNTNSAKITFKQKQKAAQGRRGQPPMADRLPRCSNPYRSSCAQWCSICDRSVIARMNEKIRDKAESSNEQDQRSQKVSARDHWRRRGNRFAETGRKNKKIDCGGLISPLHTRWNVLIR